MQTSSQRSLSTSQRAVFFVNGCIEALLLAIACISPWIYGAVGVDARLYLLVAIAALVSLWVFRLLLSNHIDWRHCPVAMCFAATILLGLLQVTPLNKSLLALIAPGTALQLQQLLPNEPEQMAPPSSFSNIGWNTAGSMISLYPGETRTAVFSLLAMFLLFLVVRNNALNPGATRRLCIALLINGSALAIFALIQFFSTPERGKIYWSYQSQGTSFGPFINRNHFAYYMNLCIGPSLGLLLACRSGSPIDYSLSLTQRTLQAARELLLSPAALWIGGGIGLMLTSVMFCLSRGGTLAMLSGAAVCFVFIAWIGARNLRLVTVLASVCISLALLMWFGLEAIEARWGTLWSGEALEDGRMYVMSHAWPLISQFPVFGTGIGTFQFVEPLALHAAADVGSLYEHAHNDYLEDLIEGGIVRLGLRIAAISWVFVYLFNAYRRHVGKAEGAMALGLLFAFTSMVIHSFFEFGLYVPAIAVLTTIICGHICKLGESEHLAVPTWEPLAQRVGVLTGLVGAAFICWLFWSEGAKAVAARDLEKQLISEVTPTFQLTADEDLEKSIPISYEIANLYPLDATKRFVVAETHFYLYKRLISQTTNPLALAGAQRQLEAALQHTVHARNLCPIMAEPNTRLAAHCEVFAKADSKSAYMNRAKRLAPADAQLWYLCGLQELTDGQAETAWESWRQSLQLSEVGLTRVLDRALAVLTPEQILEKIMPDRPAILLATAMYLYPDPQAASERAVFLQKALTLFPADSSKLTATELQTKATLCRLLGRLDEALKTYHESLAVAPEQVTARLELATLLLELDRPSEARHELGLILGLQPNNEQAKQLLEEISKLK